MAVSKRLANDVLGAIVGGVTYTPPAVWYLGLSTSPIVDGTIPNNAEPQDGTGYTRKAIQNTQLIGSNNGSFNPPTTNSTWDLAYVTNAQSIEMTEITSGSEPYVQYFFLAKTAQNYNIEGASKEVELWGSFDRARMLAINSNLIIEAGGATFALVNVD